MCDEVIHSQKEKHEESEEPEEAESAQNEYITQILSCASVCGAPEVA